MHIWYHVSKNSGGGDGKKDWCLVWANRNTLHTSTTNTEEACVSETSTTFVLYNNPRTELTSGIWWCTWNLKITAFFDVMPWSPAEVHRRFGGTSYLHLPGRRESLWKSQQVASAKPRKYIDKRWHLCCKLNKARNGLTESAQLIQYSDWAELDDWGSISCRGRSNGSNRLRNSLFLLSYFAFRGLSPRSMEPDRSPRGHVSSACS
jgi:hypothetical protein